MKLLVGIFIVILFCVSFVFISSKKSTLVYWGAFLKNTDPQDTVNNVVSKEFFEPDRFIEEAGNISESKDDRFWLNSGGELLIKDGIGSTVIGDLERDNRWRVLYGKNNPRDTEDGFRPQNIFRLITRTQYLNYTQEGYFYIENDNLSKSNYRNESNGLLFFNRYLDGNNLYYTGIRVDGAAVIKKKINGKYFTMAYQPFYSGTYDRDKNPNLLPKHTWIGLRSEVSQDENGLVNI
jgi:hypothetical protein